MTIEVTSPTKSPRLRQRLGDLSDSVLRPFIFFKTFYGAAYDDPRYKEALRAYNTLTAENRQQSNATFAAGQEEARQARETARQRTNRVRAAGHNRARRYGFGSTQADEAYSAMYSTLDHVQKQAVNRVNAAYTKGMSTRAALYYENAQLALRQDQVRVAVARDLTEQQIAQRRAARRR